MATIDSGAAAGSGCSSAAVRGTFGPVYHLQHLYSFCCDLIPTLPVHLLEPKTAPEVLLTQLFAVQSHPTPELMTRCAVVVLLIIQLLL